MPNSKYEIHISSSSEFDQTYLEVTFPNKCGFIVSRETNEDKFDVFLATSQEGSWEMLLDGTKNPQLNIPIDDLIEALEAARSKMKKMKKIS